MKYNSEIWVVPFSADLGEKNDAGNCSKKAWRKGWENRMTFTEFDIWMEKDYPKLRQEIFSKNKKLND